MLGRIAQVNYDALSIEQREQSRKAYSEKVNIDEHAVQVMLNMLKSCNSVSYEGNHWKTNKFRKEFNLTEEDYLTIIKDLEVEDYVATSRSFNLNHIGNHIIIFQPDARWELDNGSILEDFQVYIKLDLDETDGSAIALISMHKAQFLR